MRSSSSNELSRPDESEREFRARISHGSREERDRALDELRRKYAPRQAALEEKLRRANQVVERESQQATGQGIQTAISVGATIVGALLGRKAISASTIGRATTAARGVGRTMKESEDISRAKETVAALDEQRKQLDADFAAESAALDAANDTATETLEKISIKPKKTNITVKLVGLVWTK
jgi:F0F1-type ATP synthase assembly protein I